MAVVRRVLTKRAVDEVRARIQANRLVECLMKNALGELPKELSSGQIKSALGVLSYALPSLSAVQVSTDASTDQSREQLQDQYQAALKAALHDIPRDQVLNMLEDRTEQ